MRFCRIVGPHGAAVGLGILRFASAATADLIKLKHGDSIEGIVAGQDANEVRMQIEGGILTFQPSDIASIVAAPADVPRTQPPPVVSTPPASNNASSSRRPAKSPKSSGWIRRQFREFAQRYSSKPISELTKAEIAWIAIKGLRERDPLAVTVFALSALPFVLGILFCVWCVYRVAVRTGSGYAWFAWLILIPFPLVHVLPGCLLLWMAGYSAFWLLCMSAALIAAMIQSLASGSTTASMMAGIVYYGIVVLLLGPGIARSAGRSGWWGPWLFIPPISLLVWPYLAVYPERTPKLRGLRASS